MLDCPPPTGIIINNMTIKDIEALITSGEQLGLAKGYDICNKEEIMKEIKELIEEEINIKLERIGMLRQWLNEYRIDDPKKIVSNEDIMTWLFNGRKATKDEMEKATNLKKLI